MVKNFNTKLMDKDVLTIHNVLIRSGVSITHFAKMNNVSRQFMYTLFKGQARLTDSKRTLLLKNATLLAKWVKGGYLPATGERVSSVLERLQAEAQPVAEPVREPVSEE